MQLTLKTLKHYRYVKVLPRLADLSSQLIKHYRYVKILPRLADFLSKKIITQNIRYTDMQP